VESLNFWAENNVRSDELEISEDGFGTSFSNYQFIEPNEIEDLEGYDIFGEEDKLKIELLEKFISALTGKLFRFKGLGFYRELRRNPMDQARSGVVFRVPERNGWGLNYSKSSEYYENQQMSFSANGVVKTEDGREISIDYNMSMSRTFYEREEFQFSAGDAIDPIVIDFEGNGTSLTKEKYSFDLDFDGKSDQISFVNRGSGFLAYDKNGNGEIDDGSELFGPSTGNGFQELAEYDIDKNGWIDENDEIFDKLRIWHIDENGERNLVALGEKGIGAIYLNNVSGKFEFKDDQNKSQGNIKNNSIYLSEKGKAGAVHEIDLVV
jgi:hypothetical protein